MLKGAFKLKLLFTISFILNIVLLGCAGGIVYKRMKHTGWNEMRADLSPEARNLAGRHFQSSFQDIKKIAKKARFERRELVRILSAESFDRKAFEEAAHRLKGYQSDIMLIKIQTTGDLAEQLSVEDRRIMAKRMVSMLEGAKRKKRGRKKGRDGDKFRSHEDVSERMGGMQKDVPLVVQGRTAEDNAKRKVNIKKPAQKPSVVNGNSKPVNEEGSFWNSIDIKPDYTSQNE